MIKNYVIGGSILLCATIVFAIATYLYLHMPRDARNADASVALGVIDSFKDLDGRPVSLSEYEGKVRVVTSWASWSPFSAEDLRILNTLAEDLSTNSSVVFVALNRGETKEQAERYLSSLPALPKLVIVLDTTDSFYDRNEGFAMPETIIYDSRGNKVEHIRGALNQENLRTRIDELLP